MIHLILIPWPRIESNNLVLGKTHTHTLIQLWLQSKLLRVKYPRRLPQLTSAHLYQLCLLPERISRLDGQPR